MIECNRERKSREQNVYTVRIHTEHDLYSQIDRDIWVFIAELYELTSTKYTRYLFQLVESFSCHQAMVH